MHVNVQDQHPCLDVAESILAASESFLSTAMLRHALPRESAVEIEVDTSQGQSLVEFTVDDTRETPTVAVRCKDFDPHSVSPTDQIKLRDAIWRIVVEITARLVMFKDPKKALEEIIRDEGALERALNFTGSFVTVGNVLGRRPKTSISDWIGPQNKRYELNRGVGLTFPKTESETVVNKSGGQQRDLSRVKHTDIHRLSVMKDALWNQAQWCGVAYALDLGSMEPPILVILFEDIESGKKIFAGWRSQFGEEDRDNEIRVTIVEGIDRDDACSYRVGIQPNTRAYEKARPSRILAAGAQMTTMRSGSPMMMDTFKTIYGHRRLYLIAPGRMDENGSCAMFREEQILKRELNIRQAWEIGPSDVDRTLILASDKLVIPSDQNNAPVIELLRSKKKASKD